MGLPGVQGAIFRASAGENRSSISKPTNSCGKTHHTEKRLIAALRPAGFVVEIKSVGVSPAVLRASSPPHSHISQARYKLKPISGGLRRRDAGATPKTDDLRWMARP